LLATLSLSYSDVILAGDFNSNILIEKHLSNDLESLCLFPVNFKYPTHFSTTSNPLLDVFFVSDCKKIQNYDQISLLAFSKHDLKKKHDYYIEYRDFINIDYALLSAELDSFDWNSLYYTAEANTQIEILQRKVKILYDDLNHKFLQSTIPEFTNNTYLRPLNLVIEITVILFLVLVVSANAISLNQF